MSGRKSRNKGAQGEREWARFLTDHGFPAHRGRQYHGGAGTPDVAGGIPGTHAEVKRCERLNLYAALEQVTGDAGDSMPYVAHRRNGKPWVVVMRAEDFVKLCKEIKDNEGGENTDL